MTKIEIFRSELYLAIEEGNKNEILKISEKLDEEIVRYLMESKNNY